MKLTIYAKRRTSHEGKTFYNYLSKLTKKDGTKVAVSVKFKEDCGQPKPELCPCNIIVDKQDANLTDRKYTTTNSDGLEIEGIGYTLWVSKWTKGEAFVDHSLDDFE